MASIQAYSDSPPCGCVVVEFSSWSPIDYCPKHDAAPALYEALRKMCRVHHHPDHLPPDYIPALIESLKALGSVQHPGVDMEQKYIGGALEVVVREQT